MADYLRDASQFGAMGHQGRMQAIGQVNDAMRSAPAQFMQAQRHQQEMQRAAVETQLRVAGQRLKQQQFAQDYQNTMKLMDLKERQFTLQERQAALQEKQFARQQEMDSQPRGLPANMLGRVFRMNNGVPHRAEMVGGRVVPVPLGPMESAQFDRDEKLARKGKQTDQRYKNAMANAAEGKIPSQDSRAEHAEVKQRVALLEKAAETLRSRLSMENLVEMSPEQEKRLREQLQGIEDQLIEEARSYGGRRPAFPTQPPLPAPSRDTGFFGRAVQGMGRALQATGQQVSLRGLSDADLRARQEEIRKEIQARGRK